MPLAPIHRLYAKLTGLVESRLWARVLLGLFLGIGVGVVLGPAAGWVSPEVGRTLTSWLALPGDLFIRLVQMIMIPLVVASIIQGIAGDGDRERVARLGGRLLAYFLGTTLVAVAIGIGAGELIRPGRGGMPLAAAGPPPQAASIPSSADVPALITGLLPTNPLASMLAGEMLSIVTFSVIVAAALVSMPRERAEPVLNVLFSVQEICMTVTRWAMRLAPYAVFGLMARTIAKSGLSSILSLGLYVLTVLVALAVVMACYLVLVAISSSHSVVSFLRATSDVLLLAFSVASSAAVMPLTMKTAEQNLRVPPDVTRFVVPVGTILNMNGTAAYQAVATVFLAQLYGLELTLPMLILVLVTTIAASLGTPSAPGAGIVILSTVLKSVGVPLEGIAIILGVDHLLGMCRTSVNVAGDLTACVLFARGRAVAPAVTPAVNEVEELVEG
ncbi:MAG: dicarboxylate/amino acid:cation symporter [Pseudomonadota bacterium]